MKLFECVKLLINISQAIFEWIKWKHYDECKGNLIVMNVMVMNDKIIYMSRWYIKIMSTKSTT